MILTGACNGVFYALDKSSGAVIWTYDIKQDGNQRSFHANPVVENGIVYVGSDYGDYFKFRKNGVGHIYAFNLATGALKWKFKVEKGVGSDLVLDAHDIFFVTINDELVSLKKNSGELNWSIKTTGLIRGLYPKSTPIADKDKIYFASGDGNIYLVHKKTGTVELKTKLSKGIYTSLVMLKNYIYVATEDKNLYQLEKSKLELKNSFKIPHRPWTAPIVGDDALYIYCGKTLHCLTTDLKNIKWKFDMESEFGARHLVVDRGAAVAASQDGHIRSLSTKDGSLLWDYKIEGRIVGGITESDGTIYIGTREGKIFAIKV